LYLYSHCQIHNSFLSFLDFQTSTLLIALNYSPSSRDRFKRPCSSSSAFLPPVLPSELGRTEPGIPTAASHPLCSRFL
jgi:hypothetical protein